jgi:pyruvate dehydrogenase E2 component (dihydrolipoamide acetyltransferase)
MAIAITIPRLGWDMEEGVFAGWLKQDGEAVKPGESIFTLESDKATQDIESLDGGTLRIAPDSPGTGDTVAVGAVIGYLVTAGEPSPFEKEPVTAEPSSAAPLAGPAVRRLARELGVDLRTVTGTGAAGRITEEDVRGHDRQPAAAVAPNANGPVHQGRKHAVSPRARRVAAELKIDTTQLQGSGRTGRIRERDVRAAAARLSVARDTPAVPTRAGVSSIRRTIAERMVQSLRSTAPVTLTTTADATNLVSLRRQFQAIAAGADIVIPSYTDFLVKLAALALEKHPSLNARWDGAACVVSADIHVGIAVDTEAGLLVGVVRDVPRLGVRQLAARARDLAERARKRQLSTEEMQGGTFTVTNLGAFGIDAFTPIINYPECAILGVGRIQRQPVVVGEQVVVRDIVTLSLTFDHRAVDGAPAARFLQTLSKLIENPGPWLMG